MDASTLAELGLTSGEARVYLALLKSGSAKTSELALKAGVSSSKVYPILARLEQKGLVGHVIKKGTKHFVALESERLLDYIQDKEKELAHKKEVLKNLLPDLERQRNARTQPEATFYNGFNAVTNFFNNLLEELKPGETYCVVGVRYVGDTKKQKRFFHKYHQRRALKKIKLRMLANHESRKDLPKTTFLNAKVRFLPPDFLTQMNVLFYKDKSFIIVWGDEIFGFLIESRQVAESFKVYFENFWKMAKK